MKSVWLVLMSIDTFQIFRYFSLICGPVVSKLTMTKLENSRSEFDCRVSGFFRFPSRVTLKWKISIHIEILSNQKFQFFSTSGISHTPRFVPSERWPQRPFGAIADDNFSRSVMVGISEYLAKNSSLSEFQSSALAMISFYVAQMQKQLSELALKCSG